jgi:hypothetical protein
LNGVAVSLQTIPCWTPIFPLFPIPVQFARVSQSATGIIMFFQLAIATSTDAEKLMEYVEGLWLLIDQM